MRTYPLSPEETDGAPHGPRSRVARFAARAGMTLALTAGLTGVVVSPAQAANPYERGPAPTESSVTAEEGYFDTDEESVSSLVSGFGGGTIYYPTDTSEGTFGGVVIAPGYTASQSSMAWMGHRIASQGFVVFTIDTNTRYDQPDSRGAQIEAALDYLVDDSDVSDRVDGDRLAVMGHSMGGGGTLAAAEDRPELRAAIPLTPWHLQKDWSDVEVPTMIIGAENDSIASVSSHSIPFYESLDGDLERAYLELEGASHFAPNLSNTIIARYSISWLKRFVDEDERYEQFLCPPPDTGFFSDFSDYRDSCPHIT
ncbi:alpha/beta hydrolase [Nocardiopsis dassonvillei]|uniref:alpha/beta hydrolase family protein n=1 Tax=Nocardiopsis dassonvillei TaxID=2014 RepID=UPI0033FDA12B